MMTLEAKLGTVVIGRNEGDRLRLCLRSLQAVRHRVYVDSGSSDGSVALARQMDFEVVELTSPPDFTAARARNAGLARLLELNPSIEFVQMVDGDCEMIPGWLEGAAWALERDPGAAAVFGRLRERHPEASLYNMLCDDEWNVPIGEALYCGGNAMFRVRALADAGGYLPQLIAGEEPDLCLRMKAAAGWRIQRIDAEMALHDAAILKFSQWWKRARRGGVACADLAVRHGRRGHHWIRQGFSALAWGGGLLAGLLFVLIGLLSDVRWLAYAGTAMVLLFVAQMLRLMIRRRRQGYSARAAAAWAVLLMIAKIAQLQGMVQYAWRRGGGGRMKIIEYKS